MIIKEKINPAGPLPALNDEEIRRLTDQPVIYIAEEQIRLLTFADALLYTGLYICKGSPQKIQKDGKTVEVWQTEPYVYSFTLNAKGRPAIFHRIRYERVYTFYTVIMYRGTAYIREWQNRESTWLKISSTEARQLDTFASKAAAIQYIKRQNPFCGIVYKPISGKPEIIRKHN